MDADKQAWCSSESGLNLFWTGSFFAIVSNTGNAAVSMSNEFKSAINNSGMATHALIAHTLIPKLMANVRTS
jgi:ABC-type nitrate/sulfonate/bicarbonate transport system permease component